MFLYSQLQTNTHTSLKINQPTGKFNISHYKLTLISDRWFDLPLAMFGILTCKIVNDCWEKMEKESQSQRLKNADVTSQASPENKFISYEKS